MLYFCSQGRNYRRFHVVTLDSQSHSKPACRYSRVHKFLGVLRIDLYPAVPHRGKHRKGLNSYHKWLIYSQCRSERTNTLLECALLGKAIKTLISSNIYKKQQIKAKSLKRQLCKVLGALLKPPTAVRWPYLS